MKFSINAKDKQGKDVALKIDAESRIDAIRQCKAYGFLVISMEENSHPIDESQRRQKPFEVNQVFDWFSHLKTRLLNLSTLSKPFFFRVITFVFGFLAFYKGQSFLFGIPASFHYKVPDLFARTGIDFVAFLLLYYAFKYFNGMRWALVYEKSSTDWKIAMLKSSRLLYCLIAIAVGSYAGNPNFAQDIALKNSLIGFSVFAFLILFLYFNIRISETKDGVTVNL